MTSICLELSHRELALIRKFLIRRYGLPPETKTEKLFYKAIEEILRDEANTINGEADNNYEL